MLISDLAHSGPLSNFGPLWSNFKSSLGTYSDLNTLGIW